MTTFTTRAYNTIEIVPNRGTIIKRSQEIRLEQEARHYLSIPEKLKFWFPQYVKSGQDSKGYFLELEFYAYENLSSFLLEKRPELRLSNSQWTDVANLIAEALRQFNEYKKYNPPTDLEANLVSMYKTKTLREFDALRKSSKEFKKLCNSPTVLLNGIEYENFEELWKKNEIEWMNLLKKDVEISFFHGDCCFSNILLGKLENNYVLKFLDPRGLFGNNIAYGDVYYDLAKLAHSTDVGYEYFIYDKFELKKISENNATLSFANMNKKRVHQIFSSVLYSKYNERKIKLLQGLIYIGMCARHNDNKSRQIAMYLSGIKLLNELVK